MLMELKVLWTAFSAVFLAEIGDKTQLAVIILSASTKAPGSVFLGAATALILITGIGALVGRGISGMIPELIINRAAGVLFVGIGIWMLARPPG